MLADQLVKDRRQVQLVLLEELMRLGTALTQVQFFLLVVLDVGQMHRGRVGAELALHASFLPLFCAGDPTTLLR